MCAQRRLRSAWASTQSDQSLLSVRRKLESLAIHWAPAKTLIRLGGCPGWSESLLGAQSFCWFCHVVAQMSFKVWNPIKTRSCRQNLGLKSHSDGLYPSCTLNQRTNASVLLTWKLRICWIRTRLEIHDYMLYKLSSMQKHLGNKFDCHKHGQGQPRVIIWTNLEVLEHPMLYTEVSRSSAS